MVKFIRRVVIFGVLLIMGIVFLVRGISRTVEFNKPHADLSTMTGKDLYEGRFVEGDIIELWDEFSYTEEYDETLGVQTNKRVTDHFFAMPMEYSFDEENIIFIAVATRNENELKTFNTIVQETYDFYDGVEMDDFTQTHFVGRVERLKGEYLDFFREYVAEMYDVSKSEADKYLAPYVLRSTTNNGGATGSLVTGIILTVIGTLGTAFFVVRKVLTGR